jgi:hypothetical protein
VPGAGDERRAAQSFRSFVTKPAKKKKTFCRTQTYSVSECVCLRHTLHSSSGVSPGRNIHQLLSLAKPSKPLSHDETCIRVLEYGYTTSNGVHWWNWAVGGPLSLAHLPLAWDWAQNSGGCAHVGCLQEKLILQSCALLSFSWWKSEHNKTPLCPSGHHE